MAAGNQALQNVKYTRCERDGCYVEALVDGATVNALSAPGVTTSVNVIGYGQTNLVALPISTNGFADALNRMRTLARERAVPIPMDQPTPMPLTVTAYTPPPPPEPAPQTEKCRPSPRPGACACAGTRAGRKGAATRAREVARRALNAARSPRHTEPSCRNIAAGTTCRRTASS